MTTAIHLRQVQPEDLDAFFLHQQDQDANHMAAFGAKDPNDRGVFDLHWQNILNDETVTARTIEAGGEVVGHILVYVENEAPELSYWIGKAYWGRGITTAAVGEFLKEYSQRPLRARAVADNEASIKILTTHGFTEQGEVKSFASSRGEVVREIILELV